MMRHVMMYRVRQLVAVFRCCFPAFESEDVASTLSPTASSSPAAALKNPAPAPPCPEYTTTTAPAPPCPEYTTTTAPAPPCPEHTTTTADADLPTELNRFADASDNEEAVNSLRRLDHLLGPRAMNEVKAVQVFDHPDVLSRIIDLMQRGDEDAEAAQCALAVMSKISSYKVCAIKLVEECPGYAQVLLRTLTSGDGGLLSAESEFWDALCDVVVHSPKEPANSLMVATIVESVFPLAMRELHSTWQSGGELPWSMQVAVGAMASNADIAASVLLSEYSAELLIWLAEMVKEGYEMVSVELAVMLTFNLALPASTRGVLRNATALIRGLVRISNIPDALCAHLAAMAVALLYGELRDASMLATTTDVLAGAVFMCIDMFTAGFGDDDDMEKKHLALRYLVVADHNRRMLWQELGSKLLKDLIVALEVAMKRGRVQTAEDMVCILSQFSSDEEPCKWMRENRQAYAPTLALLAEKKSEFNAAHVAAQYWLLSVFPPEVSDTPEPGTVMISYQWEFQKQARVIHTVLESLGLKVWRDEKNMRDDVNASMADAVSRSSTVLVLVSRKYKESANCKKECEFAERKLRKIVPVLVEPGYASFTTDGWLGLVLGSKLYYNVSEHRSGIEHEDVKGIAAVIQNLVQNELHGGQPAGATVVAAAVLPPPRPALVVVVPQNAEEMRAWLVRCSAEDGDHLADKLVEHGLARRGEKALQLLASNSLVDLKQLLELDAMSALLLNRALRELFPK